MRTIIRFCIFCAVLISTTSCNSSRHSFSSGQENFGWKIAKVDKSEEPSWVISTRKIKGTNFLEYKIEGDIESSTKACVSAFRQDIHNQADDLKNKKYPTYEISEESDDSLLTYLVHNEPFPLKDTEMCVRYKFYSDEDGSTGVRWNEAWEHCPIQPSKKLKRVQTFRGSLNFVPASNDYCKAVKSVQFDPEKMPLWLVEPMVFKFLKKGLQDIREMASSKKTSNYHNKI